jgi:hypothetical protein
MKQKANSGTNYVIKLTAPNEETHNEVTRAKTEKSKSSQETFDSVNLNHLVAQTIKRNLDKHQGWMYKELTDKIARSNK